ncbi:MAG: hypothetical protein IKY83_08895 [Proteobacteria bacterium]|nr:hypothetical protein [Pseudomonadota bacterium]
MKAHYMLAALVAGTFVLGCNAKTDSTDNTAKQEAENGQNADEAKADSNKADEAKDDSGKEDEAKADETRPVAAQGSQAEAAGVTCEEAEGCDCGETKCPMNAVCTDGVCKCGETLVESDYTGYICMEIGKGVYDLGCTESKGCPCGKTTVFANMGCSGKWATCGGYPVPGRGLSCRHKPHKDRFYSLGCFKDSCDCFGTTISKDEICEAPTCTAGFSLTPQGCTCDGRVYADGYTCVLGKESRLVSYCTAPDGCACGEATCPKGGVCRRDKCVDRTTLKEIPEGYEIVNGFPKCTADECACHKTKCKSGQHCLNGVCYTDPYFRKLDGKTYYFRIASDAHRDALWNFLFMDESDELCTHGIAIREGDRSDDLCKDPEHSAMTVAEALKHCGTAPIPQKVATMFCTLDMKDGALHFSGWQAE